MVWVGLCLDKPLLIGERVLGITEVETDFDELRQEVRVFAIPI